MPGAQGPKTVNGALSDPNYVSRLLLDCVPVFHKIITPAYLLFRSGPVAIYYSRSECLPGAQKLQLRRCVLHFRLAATLRSKSG